MEAPFWPRGCGPKALSGGWRLDLKDTLWGPMDATGRNRRMQAAWRRGAAQRGLWLRSASALRQNPSAPTLPPPSETQFVPAEGPLAPFASEVKILNRPHSQGGLELGLQASHPVSLGDPQVSLPL